MRVSTKLAAGYAVPLVLLGSLLAYHVSVIRHIEAANLRLSDISSRLASTSTEQLHWLEELSANAAKYRVTGDAGYAERFHVLAERLDASIRNLAALPVAGQEGKEVSRLLELWEHFLARRTALGEPAAGPASDGDGEPVAVPVEPLEGIIGDLRQQTRQVSEASRSAMLEQVARSSRRAERAERLAWIVGGGALLLVLLVPAVIIRSISASLRRLTVGTHAVSEGDFAYQLEGSHDKEFQQLADDFNVMVKRLGELDRVKRDFLSKISHDLKSPLASVQEAIQVLLDELLGPLNQGQRRMLTLSLQSGERLSSMISKLLDLSRMEARAIEYEFQSTDVARLARRVVAEMDPRAREAGVELRLAVPEGLEAECDPERIVQVLENLLENALKFSPAGSTIEILGRAVPSGTSPIGPAGDGGVPEIVGEDCVHLSVSDQGPGVPDELKEKVFDRFVQGTPVPTRRAGAPGVGLGLTICREIVTAHGGRTWVSDRPGGGSVFSVLLPRLALPASEEPAATEPASSAA